MDWDSEADKTDKAVSAVWSMARSVERNNGRADVLSRQRVICLQATMFQRV